MSVQKFSVATTNAILAQPDVEQIYSRSDNAADTGNLTLTGLHDGDTDSSSETHALLGKREVVASIDPFDSLTGAILSVAQTGVVSVYAFGVAASGFIIISTQPANNDTLKIGLTGFQQTYTFKTTLTGAANEVKIGADVSATGANLSAAINAGAGAGTTYGTGTAANAYVSATVSASLLTITDKIACKRQLTWAISQTVGATIGIALPAGGVDGTLLATLAIGVTQSYNAFRLDSEDLVATTLPALLAPTTDAVFVGGKVCTIRFKTQPCDTPALHYETSTDGANWAIGKIAISDIADYTVAGPLFVIPPEQNIEYVRLFFENNTNTTDIALDAGVIY